MIDRTDENMVVLIVASPNPKWQNHPHYLFARVVYTFFENKGTEDYRRNGEEDEENDPGEISRPRGIVAKIWGTNRGQTIN